MSAQATPSAGRRGEHPGKRSGRFAVAVVRYGDPVTSQQVPGGVVHKLALLLAGVQAPRTDRQVATGRMAEGFLRDGLDLLLGDRIQTELIHLPRRRGLSRTWYRRESGWFGHALLSRRARIRVPGLAADVTVEDLGQGEVDLRAGVDAAYRTKYGQHGSESMVTAAAAATTLRLAPDR
jgi:hypothetical protein